MNSENWKRAIKAIIDDPLLAGYRMSRRVRWLILLHSLRSPFRGLRAMLGDCLSIRVGWKIAVAAGLLLLSFPFQYVWYARQRYLSLVESYLFRVRRGIKNGEWELASASPPVEYLR